MRLLDEIDWGSLEHACGPALDTRAHLEALTSTDIDAHKKAIHHLCSAIAHQGFPDPATAPTTRVVAWMLAEGMAASEVREVLVEILGDMAMAARNGERDACFSDLLPSLDEAMQQSYPTVVRFLDDPDLSMRKTAARAASCHVETRGLTHQQPALAARLRAWAIAAPEERAHWVRELSLIPDNTEDFLADADAHVRVSAALSAALAGHSLATEIIIDALFLAAERGGPIRISTASEILFAQQSRVSTTCGGLQFQPRQSPAANTGRSGNQCSLPSSARLIARASSSRLCSEIFWLV